MTPESLHNQAIRKRPLVGARGLYSSFLVLLGYTIGFGHGTWTSSNLAISTSTPGLYSSKGQEFRLDRCQSADATSADKWQGMDQHEGTGDGWKSIHVFYGNRSHLIKHKIETSASFAATNSSISKTELSLAEPLVEGNNQNTPFHEWYSQARQDEIVVALFGGKTGGYYVDLAANDATHWSNTYALEQGYQWNGLCIEPNPWYWKNLSYRTCTVVAAVVGGSRSIGPRSEVQNQQRNNTEVYFRFDAGTHGGIADEGFDNNRRWQKHSQLASTVPLLGKGETCLLLPSNVSVTFANQAFVV